MKACYGELNASFDSATSPTENSITILPGNSTQNLGLSGEFYFSNSRALVNFGNTQKAHKCVQ